MNDLSRPLSGVRILDLSTVVAGPFGSEIMGYLGADVIRIDPPPAETGEAMYDASRPVSDAEGFTFALQKNKRSMCVDLKSAAGREVFHDLVRKSDIVWDNFRTGVLSRLGIDYAHLQKINQRIICCSMTGYGGEGPWAEVGAYDITVQALSGVMSFTGLGEDNDYPCRWGVPIGDIAGSLYGVIAVLAALADRDATGEGQQVEISLLDAQLALHTYRVPQAFGAGVTFEAAAPRRGGAGTVPYGPFRCGDDAWLVIAVASNFWLKFCDVIDRNDLATDPRFKTLQDRQANQAALDEELERVLAGKPAAEWEDLLAAEGVPVGKVNTIAEALRHPQASARDMLVHLPGLGERVVETSGSPLRFSGEPVWTQHAPSPRGRDTHSVLAEVLGYPEAQIASLQDALVVDGRSA